MKHPNPNILLQIGIADAYAAGAEYLKFPQDQQIKEDILKFEKYHPHPAHELAAGRYTDDTEMSLANANVLLYTTHPYSTPQFLWEYLKQFKQGGSRKGYSKAFQSILESCNSGKELQEKLIPNSVANGACMRAAVLGVISTIEGVLQVATVQAQTTHDTPEGRFSARAVALMSHLALYTDWPFAKIIQYIVGILEYYYPEDYQFAYTLEEWWDDTRVAASKEKPSIALSTVQAVSTLIIECHSLLDMLKTTIEWGGDTDSVAAVAWGIAGCRYQNEKLPAFLEKDLENAQMLKDVGAMLMKRFA